MRQLFLVIAIIFSVLSVVFAFLPLGTLALIPIIIALVFGYLALKSSNSTQAKLVKVLLVISGLCLVFILGKEIFIKDEVEADQQFNNQKVQSKQEAQKELEDLEGLE